MRRARALAAEGRTARTSLAATLGRRAELEAPAAARVLRESAPGATNGRRAFGMTLEA